MAYLYGDSTPFPIEENFLETAAAGSAAAVAFLRADELRVEEKRLAGEAEQRSLHEIAHLEKFGSRVEDIYADPIDELRAHLGDVARAMIAEMGAGVLRWRDAAVASALATAAQTRVLPALGVFFEHHQLPGTAWSFAWRARLDNTSTVAAQVHARAPGGLDASFDVTIPEGHLWSKPARISTLDQDRIIHLMKKRVLRKPRLSPETLDALFVTEVIDLPGERAMTLRRSSKKPSRGLRIVLPSEASKQFQVSRIDEKGARLSEPEVMGPADSAVLEGLFSTIAVQMRSLVHHRSRIRAAYFRDTPVAELEQPGVLGKLFIESLAPFIREIARRSNARTELALKRALSDGRREELFIPHALLLTGAETLASHHRALFDAFDLTERRAGPSLLDVPGAVPRLALFAGTDVSRATMPSSIPPAASSSLPPSIPPSLPPPLPPARSAPPSLPPARLPPSRPPARAQMGSDALRTQERPIVRV